MQCAGDCAPLSKYKLYQSDLNNQHTGTGSLKVRPAKLLYIHRYNYIFAI